MAIVVRAAEGSRVLRSGHLDGWSPRFITGFPVFLHYGPGLAIAFTILRFLSLGFLSSVGAIQVLFAVAFAAVGPATWFLARSLGMNGRAATGAGIAALAVNSPFGVGLAGLYTIGLLPHALAAPFVLAGLGAVVRCWTRPEERRWLPLAGTCFAIVIVTHVISTLIAAMLAAVIGAVVVAQRTGIRERVAAVHQGALVALAAGGLAAFWLFPYVRHFGERGVVPAWGTATLYARVDDIIAGRFVLGHYVALFVVAGWAWALLAWRRSGVLAFAAPVAAIVFMIVSHWYYAHSPTTELAQQLANRGVGYACVLAIIPLGGLIDELGSSYLDRRATAVFVVCVSALIVVFVPGKPRLIDIPKQQPSATPAALEVAAEIRRRVPRGARFATERDFPAEIAIFGMSHPDFWLAERAGRNTVNTYNLELSQSGGAGSTAENLRDNEDGSINAERFRRFGVTHLVTVEPRARDRLLATKQFRRVFASGQLAILRVLAPPDSPDAGSLIFLDHGHGTASLDHMARSSEHYRFTTRSADAVSASIAVGWSSAWHVKVDGQTVRAHKTPDGLVGIRVPAGKHQIALDLRRDYAGVFGLLVGTGTAVWLIRTRQPRSAREQTQTEPSG